MTKKMSLLTLSICCFILAMVVLAFMLVSCSFDPSIFMPPGASVPVEGIQLATTFPSVESINTPFSVETPSSLLFFVAGDWRCHILPNEASDTRIFLHDGEQVQLLQTGEKWGFIQAGKYQCYVKLEALIVQ